VSPALLEEYRAVPLALEAEGKINHAQFKALVAGVAALVARATLVYPQRALSICRDPEDNMLLECALEAKARILITGDKDLSELAELPLPLRILSPREFIEWKKRKQFGK